jgi:hypothetical protein
MKPNIRLILTAFILLLALTLPASAQSGISNFTHIVTTGYVQSGTYVLGGSYVKATTNLESTTFTKVGTFLRITPATSITVTTDSLITPLGSYQPLTSAGTVQTASIAAGTAGDLLTLINTTNTSIVFTDTGTLKLGGNRTLGQFDSLMLVSDGTNWVERAFANN